MEPFTTKDESVKSILETGLWLNCALTRPACFPSVGSNDMNCHASCDNLIFTFYFLCDRMFCLCMSVYHVCAWCQEENVSSPVVIDYCELLCAEN